MTMDKRIELEQAIGPDNVLVVNSTMEVREVVPWQEAVTMLFNEKVYTLMATTGGEQLHSARLAIDKPLVVCLVKYAQRHNKVFDLEEKVAKAYVRQRDNFTCQYCGKYGNTVDHIQPKSRGGGDTWGNLVTSCSPCNNFKADRTPEEAGMKRPVVRSGIVVSAKIARLQGLAFEAMAEMTA